eukprot:11223846-Lingulodinium_polyedra.AAC.1
MVFKREDDENTGSVMRGRVSPLLRDIGNAILVSSQGAYLWLRLKDRRMYVVLFLWLSLFAAVDAAGAIM